MVQSSPYACAAKVEFVGRRTLAFAGALIALALALPTAWGSVPSGSNSVGFDYATYPFSSPSSREMIYPSLTGRFHGRAASAFFEAVGDLELQLTYRPQASASFIEAPEAYFGTSEQVGPVQIKFGRKLERWNHLDDAWQMGIWQPRFRWDYIRPEATGLVGGFIHFDTPFLQFVAFGSPGFIPERGVPMTIENGSIVSNSPWYIPPPSKITILDQATPVQYSVAVPPIEDIVMHPGVSLMARAGSSLGPWFQAGYAYKPMNQLLLAYDGYLQLGSNVAVATLYPRVLYHELLSAEVGFTTSEFRGWVSSLSDRPIRDVTHADWTTQEVSHALSVSPTLDYRLGGSRDYPTILGLSYLHVWGGNAPDGGLYAGGKAGSVFDTRYPFENALSFSARASLSGLGGVGHRIVGSVRLLQDFGHQGSILSTEFAYRPNDAWVVAAGADVLGSDSISNAMNAGSDFISHYQGNDRVHLGVSYVF